MIPNRITARIGKITASSTASTPSSRRRNLLNNDNFFTTLRPVTRTPPGASAICPRLCLEIYRRSPSTPIASCSHLGYVYLRRWDTPHSSEVPDFLLRLPRGRPGG